MPNVIGVYGLIGSGKTTVAKIIEKRYGFYYIDCDSIGHSILETDEVKKELLAEYGLLVVSKEGLIDRKKLSRIVFADLHLKSKLEAILWPKMTIKMKDLIEQKKEVVLEAAVLFSAGWNQLCQATIYIEAPVQKQFRFLKARHISENQLTAILESQQEVRSQKDLATYQINNAGTREELEKKVEQVMSLLQKRRME